MLTSQPAACRHNPKRPKESDFYLGHVCIWQVAHMISRAGGDLGRKGHLGQNQGPDWDEGNDGQRGRGNQRWGSK